MKARRVIILFVDLALLLVGCGPPQPTATLLAVGTPTGLLTDTSVPTATPIPLSPTREPVLHAGWTSHTNANYVEGVAFDHNGNLWAVGPGGVVRWDPTDGTYTK